MIDRFTMRLSFSLVTCLSFLFGPDLHAVEFQAVGVDRGLDAKIVSSLLIDRHGFLWAASREGLYRYDGYNAERFMPDGRPGSITDADLRMLYEAKDGRIWVATNNGGLNVYDPVTGSFSSYRHRSNNPATLSNDSIYGMAETGDDRMWVGTQIGLNRLDLETGIVERFLHDPDDPHSISNDYIFEVYRDSEGRVWFTTLGGGLNHWNETEQYFDHFDLQAMTGGPDSLNSIFAVAETDDGTLWFGTRGGLVRLDAASAEFTLVSLGLPDDGDHTITQLIVDKRQHIWISLLSEGVMVYEPENLIYRAANPQPLGSGGQLPAVPQISLAMAQDLLFVGTWGSGVFSGRVNEMPADLLGVGPKTNGLAYGNVTSVMADATDGQPWVGTFNGSLERADFLSNPVPISTEVLRDFADGVLSIARLADGKLFMGLSQGLLELSTEVSEDIFHQHDADIEGSIGAGYVTSLESGDKGGLWVGVGGSGLFHYIGESGVFTSYVHDPEDDNSISGNYVTSLLLAEGGQLWVGTRSHGLNRCTVDPWQCERFVPGSPDSNSLGHFHITSVYQGRGGYIWITTAGGGLHRADMESDGSVSGFTRWTRRDGLISDATMAVLQDDDDSLWISSREGLSRLNPVTGQVANFVEAAGLPASAFNTNSAGRDDQLLYFGALSGLLSVPAGQEFTSRIPAPVSITRVEEPTESAPDVSLTAQPDSLSIKYGDLISIGFAVLDFAEVPHEYEYQADASHEWVSLGNRQEITFSGLSPGSHEIRIRGRDIFGLWRQADPVKISVIPPFWMTNWFRVIALTMITLLILAAHQTRMNILQKRNRQLQTLQVSREAALERANESHEQMEEALSGMRNLTARLDSAKEKERQILSRELHDELGQMLTAAKINLQLARSEAPEASTGKRLEDSIEMIDQMIRQVRDISLSLRPPLLDAAGLVPALEYYLGALEKRAGIPISFDAKRVTKGNRPEVRTTVFRIIQEAVSNAIRHASASSIHVSLCTEGKFMLVRIEDDGCGFDAVAINERIRRGEHLGLLGMHERVLGVGGSFTLDSKPGSGSLIHAKVPL